jgi:hypothetical protein
MDRPTGQVDTVQPAQDSTATEAWRYVTPPAGLTAGTDNG